MKNAQDSVRRGDGPREEEEERGSIASEDSSSSGSSSPDQDKALLLLNSFQEDSQVEGIALSKSHFWRGPQLIDIYV